MPELIDQLFCCEHQKIRNYSIDRVKFSGYTQRVWQTLNQQSKE